MSLCSFVSFSKSNRRLIGLLIAGHVVWSFAVYALWQIGQLIEAADPLWSGIFAAVQIFAAAQLLLPVLLFKPEARTRGFYLFWGLSLALGIWLINCMSAAADWQLLLTALRSGLLLLAATVTGAALARYVHRLREIVPVCLVMSLADVASWLYGPTAAFSRQIEQHYLAPGGSAPLVDMILIKLAVPGGSGLTPVFGISDWIMAAFFAIVARRHGVNDNILGISGEKLVQNGRLGFYLPVPVAALFAAVGLAQATGLFIPALPFLALTVLLWYAVRHVVRRS